MNSSNGVVRGTWVPATGTNGGAASTAKPRPLHELTTLVAMLNKIPDDTTDVALIARRKWILSQCEGTFGDGCVTLPSRVNAQVYQTPAAGDQKQNSGKPDGTLGMAKLSLSDD